MLLATVKYPLVPQAISPELVLYVTNGVPVTAAEAAPAPRPLTALIRIVYSVPLLKPVTTNGDVTSAGLKGV